MENNKILINLHFVSEDKGRIITLMILRDASLRQLMDSILYGLEKKVKLESRGELKSDESVLSYSECLNIYNQKEEELKTYNETEKKYWGNISIAMFDGDVLDTKERTVSYEYENNSVRSSVKTIVLFDTDLDKPLCDLGFISSTFLVFFSKDKRPNTPNFNTDNICDAFDPDSRIADIKFPRYNISTRLFQSYDRDPVEIIPPSNPPQKPNLNIWMLLIPTVLTVGVMTLLRTFLFNGAGTGASFILMSIAMSAVSFLTSIFSWSQQKKNYEKALASWKENYEAYIRNLIAAIKNRNESNVKKLNNNYPGLKTLFDNVSKLKDDIFSRTSSNSDFLTVNLGTCDQVESLFEIKGTSKDEVFSPAYFELNTQNDTVSLSLIDQEDSNNGKISSDMYISNLPKVISEKYKYMKRAPYLYSLSKCGSLGVLYNDEVSEKYGVEDCPLHNFIQHLVFELSYYHSPEYLQFVIFFPETDNETVKYRYVSRYVNLPHCRELFDDMAQFVFSSKYAGKVFSRMLNIMEERKNTKSENTHHPHVVFIVYDEYNLKEHAFASLLPQAPKDGTAYQNDLGMTFIFAKKYKEYLPEFCNDIITLSSRPGDSTCKIRPYNSNSLYGDSAEIKINCDHVLPADKILSTGNATAEELNKFRMLSGIYYTRISQNRQVPSSVSLYKQFGISSDIKEKSDIEAKKNNLCNVIKGYISEQWGYDRDNNRRHDVVKTLAVPIGKTDDSDGNAILDLHEKADGPHMLVAGTTGSGKSETIISYLIGLCMLYRPDEVNMMLVDMKGGGFTKRLGSLPHVVGKVTDIDGDENNTSAEYMLKRFLVAIKSEVKRRKLVINHFPNVDSIDGYIKKCRDLESNSDTDPKDLEYIKENPLTHLILVVDEFTELKRFSAENSDINYMSEITTIARIGRSLGIHIILISQNIEGAITDDIRVNSKSRLCLKVATRQASKEMIGNDLAALPSMPGNGRAYLFVGNGTKFEYFQSAYSGVIWSENSSSEVLVMNIENEGEYSPFYMSSEDNPDVIAKRKSEEDTQLQLVVRSVCETYEEKKSTMGTVRSIFRDPLPTSVVYDKKIHAAN